MCIFIKDALLASVGIREDFSLEFLFVSEFFCIENSPTTQNLAEWKDIDGKRLLWRARREWIVSEKGIWACFLRKYFETIRTNPEKSEWFGTNSDEFTNSDYLGQIRMNYDNFVRICWNPSDPGDKNQTLIQVLASFSEIWIELRLPCPNPTE